ncbi:immunoglobulin domain-containing protein, partial [Escherichia coli]|uniref:immunoglobulin domain-containing protein n=1 Tax=Escherichia coli TaxID=562 RepID=UPI0034DE8279
ARGSNLTYQWYKDGQPQANLTEPVIIISESTPEQSGSYTCTITSDCGEVTTDAAVIVIEKKVIDHVAEAWPAGSVLTVRPMPVGNAG